MKNQLTLRKSLAFYMLLQAVFFSPIILQGKLIYPHDNSIEVGITGSLDQYQHNRKFADESRTYIPNLHQHLNAKRHNSLTLWDHSVELGKPTGQLTALGRSYILTNIISFFTHDALRVFTTYIVITVALAGILFFYFLQSFKVSNETCLFATTIFSNGIFFSYWQTFPMNISVFCWATGIMLFSRLCLSKAELRFLFALLFSVYSLLMTAGPQEIILLAYLFIPFVLLEVFKSKRTLRRFISLAVPTFLGILLALPVFLDLLLTSARSARNAVSLSDYLVLFPRFNNVQEFLSNFLLLFDAYLIKTAELSNLPYSFNGHSFSASVFVLFLLSLIYLRGHRLFKFYVFFCLIGAYFAPAYAIYFKYLGFYISRATTLGGLVLAVPFLASMLFEKILKSEIGIRQVIVCYLLVLITSVFIFQPISKCYLIINLLVFSLFLSYLKLRKQTLLFLFLAAQVYFYSAPLRHFRAKESIYSNSPVIEILRAATKNGQYRFAKIALPRDFISSNQESIWGLKSIHANDSLSSKAYQDLIASLSSQKTGYYGRISTSLAADAKIDSEEFSHLGVSALVSSVKLESKKFYLKREIGDLYIYQAKAWPSLAFKIGVPKNEFRYNLARDFSDKIELEINDKVVSPGIVFLSEQYHPNWKAIDQNSKTLEVLAAKDFYLGAKIPKGTRRITFYYSSIANWAIFSQAFIFLLFLFVLLKAFMRKDTLRTAPSTKCIIQFCRCAPSTSSGQEFHLSRILKWKNAVEWKL